MKNLWTAAFGVVGGLLGAGLILLLSSPPRGGAVLLDPPPTPAPLVVHIAGAVEVPGVYSLPAGSRVGDAIQAAGGLTAAGASEAVNLAAPLHDGQKVSLPTRVPTRAPGESPGSSQAPPAEDLPAATQVSFPININSAGAVELDALPGIGPVTAEKIIAYREANGPFPDIEAIQDVSGIGPATFAKLRDLITVDGP